MIKLQVIGHLGTDALANTVMGNNVINFSVAHSEKYKDSQGVQKEKTTWVECAYWTDRTAIVPYLRKGTQVYVDGAPEVRSYTTKDGQKGSSLVLRVSSVQLLGNSENRPSNNSSGYGYSTPNEGQGGYSNDYAQRVGHGRQGATGAIEPDEITEPLDDLPF
jgi:single-strand DNA-binding protein